MMKTQNIFAALLRRFLLAAYPVGSLYWSLDSTSPGTLFGGTWVRITDTFIVAAGSQYPAGTSGGAPSINLQHSHTTSNHTLTVAEIPLHSHSIVNGNSVMCDVNNSSGGWGCAIIQLSSGYIAQSRWLSNQTTGGGNAHNHGSTYNSLSSAQPIIPPYESYYCWRRTA